MAKAKKGSSVSPKAPSTRSKRSTTESPASKKAVSESPIPKKTKKSPKKAVEEVDEPVVNEPELTSVIVSAPVATSLTTKAVTELANFLTRRSAKKQEEDGESKKSLFDDEDDKSKVLYVEVNTKKFVSSRIQLKPKVLKLTNAIYDRESTRTCLIIRDLLASNPTQIELLEKEHLPTISQILPIEALKSVYKTFEKRRELQAEYDLFLVDDAVFNLMPTLLGKTFYGNHELKLPIPVRVVSTTTKTEISLKSLTNSLERSLYGTAYLPPVGTQIHIKVGSINNVFTTEQLVQNVQDVIASFSKDDLVNILVKTTGSPALPLFYADKLYDASEVVKAGDAPAAEEEKVSAFEQGLLELASAEDVKKVLGEKKLKVKAFKVVKA